MRSTSSKTPQPQSPSPLASTKCSISRQASRFQSPGRYLRPLAKPTVAFSGGSPSGRPQKKDSHHLLPGQPGQSTRRRAYREAGSRAPYLEPHFILRVLLDELRVSATHHQLAQQVDHYLTCSDLYALFNQVLDRFEQDYDQDRPDLTRDTLKLIFASRRGMTESELLERTYVREESPILPAAIWSPLSAALDELLSRQGQLLNLGRRSRSTSRRRALLQSTRLSCNKPAPF